MDTAQQQYLKLLSESFPNSATLQTEISISKAALSLPKENELFVSDIHGEYESFAFIVRSGCGAVQNAIEEAFQDLLSKEEKQALLMLVCFPEKKLALELQSATNRTTWYQTALNRLAALCNQAAQGHSLTQINEALSLPYAPVVKELLAQVNLSPSSQDALDNLPVLINSLIETNCAEEIITELARVIQRLCTGKLHVVGDIYDRGPLPDLVMEELINHHSLDIQWGNHDIVWMGAALGQRGCIAHVVRNCARYGNLSILSEAYGINLLPLVTFAREAYKDDPCVAFGLKGNPDLPADELELNIKIQKAMAILQFKVEAQIIDENPSFGLEDRKLLDKINFETNTVVVDGIEYALTDTVFPTIDTANPNRLTAEEEQVMAELEKAFISCEKLQRHIALFLEKGSLYKIENNTLMFHACVPLNEDGTLKEVTIFDETYKGRALFDAVDYYVRAAFNEADPEKRKQGLDLLWYLWLGEGSPLFAKSKMATFELYLIAEKPARKEVKNSFYSLLEDKTMFARIFENFGMDPNASRIVCGHVPVKVKDGEDPVKCDGMAVIIDGGFSAAYQPTTGIAGMTLISNSQGVSLASHEPFIPLKEALVSNTGVTSTVRSIVKAESPLTKECTDEGLELKQKISGLEQLLVQYQKSFK